MSICSSQDEAVNVEDLEPNQVANAKAGHQADVEALNMIDNDLGRLQHHQGSILIPLRAFQ